MATKTRQDVENMSAADRLWDSLDYSYGKKREESSKNYDKAISQQDRQMLGRGMQRSSYNAQTLANMRKEQAKASDDIYDAQIADYENRLHDIEREEKQDEQWQKQFDEGVRQFNENMGYQKERAAVQDQQWQTSFDYQKGRDAVADNQWQQTFDYQQRRDTVADQHWQAEFDEGVRQFDVKNGGAAGGGGGGGGGGKPATTTGNPLDLPGLNNDSIKVSAPAFSGIAGAIGSATGTKKNTTKKTTTTAKVGGLASALTSLTKKK